MNPLLEKYLKDKFGENYDKISQDGYSEKERTINAGSIASSFGDALAGRAPGSRDEYFNGLKKEAKANTIGKVDLAKKDFAVDYNLDRQISEDTQKDDQLRNDSDANSEGSKIAQSLAVKMGMNPEQAKTLTAAKWKSYSPALEKMYQVEQNKLARQDAINQRAYDRNEKKSEKLNDRELSLAVPGMARTGEVLPKVEEAQKLRKAVAFSETLSNKLKRMSELVKSKGSFEYGGNAGQEMEGLAAEIQLVGKSPELYELGVLSGSDLKMLEKITSDPSSLSSLFTQDSTRQTQIASQLKSLQDKLSTSGKSMGYVQKDAPQKTVVDRQINKKTGQTRLVYSDGSTEIVQNIAGAN